MRILVIEDESRIQAFVRRGLEAEGYGVATADDGHDGLSLARSGEWDLVVLDLLLPGLNGLRVLQELHREQPLLPVLILSARGDLRTKLKGFELGACDYVAKPFALDELLARVRAMLRRRNLGSDADQDDEPLVFADLTMNPVTREVDRGGRPITLTRTEWDLLELFMRRPKRVLERAFILEEVWGYDFPTTANSLEVYVGYVRRKTEGGGEDRLLHTVRGVGYVLRETPP